MIFKLRDANNGVAQKIARKVSKRVRTSWPSRNPRRSPSRQPTQPSPLSITDLVHRVNEQLNNQFADLAFLDPGGLLDVSERIESVTALHIEASGQDFLRLASVLIDAEGLSDPINETTWNMSSVWPGYEKKLKSGLFFDPSNTRTAIHSKEEHRPWLHIAFSQTVHLNRVRLRNRPDHVLRNRPDMPARVAPGIQIRCQTADGRWRILYDGVQRQREMMQLCSAWHGSVLDQEAPSSGGSNDAADQSPIEVGGDLALILGTLHRREYLPALLRDLAQTKLSAKAQREFREAVNRHILQDRNLEWIMHGVRRSFRFWSSDEKRRYVAHAMEVVNDLSDLTPSVCFGFGSVLAVVRDNDLIPHDDDLDLIVGFESQCASTIAEAFSLIEKHLTDKGYIVAGEHHAHRRVSQPGVKKVDVFAGIFEDGYIGWYPGHRAAIHHDTIFPGKLVSFLGTDCLIPRDSEGYLEHVYGPGWRSPDKHFNHGTAARKEYSGIER